MCIWEHAVVNVLNLFNASIRRSQVGERRNFEKIGDILASFANEEFRRRISTVCQLRNGINAEPLVPSLTVNLIRNPEWYSRQTLPLYILNELYCINKYELYQNLKIINHELFVLCRVQIFINLCHNLVNYVILHQARRVGTL